MTTARPTTATPGPETASQVQAAFPCRVKRFNDAALHPTRRRFNCSLLDFQDRRLLAYRVGWVKPEICIATLSPDLEVTEGASLDLRHGLCSKGCEDPRLFIFRGRLHVAFCGVEHVRGVLTTHQLMARLTDDLDVEEVWCPAYAARTWPLEKNHVPFVWAGELFTVYSIRPHLVLHHFRRQALPFARTEAELSWSGGMLRGGAPPVQVGDEFFCFFHGARDGPAGGPKRVYNMGCYVFGASPPFRIKRITPEPIMWPLFDRPADVESAVVFPCGAIREGGRWLVSYGLHDTFSEVVEFDADRLERALVPVG